VSDRQKDDDIMKGEDGWRLMQKVHDRKIMDYEAGETETDPEIDRQRQTDRDIQTETERDRQTETDRQRQTDRDRQTETDRQRERQKQRDR